MLELRQLNHLTATLYPQYHPSNMLCITAFFDKNSCNKATNIYIKSTANKLLDHSISSHARTISSENSNVKLNEKNQTLGHRIAEPLLNSDITVHFWVMEQATCLLPKHNLTIYAYFFWSLLLLDFQNCCSIRNSLPQPAMFT